MGSFFPLDGIFPSLLSYQNNPGRMIVSRFEDSKVELSRIMGPRVELDLFKSHFNMIVKRPGLRIMLSSLSLVVVSLQSPSFPFLAALP
jgi:hypothetical protein